MLKRARLRGEGESLAGEIESLLRRWPLSGVLVDLDGEPSKDLSFDGHSGLLLLYSERLRVHGRVGWLTTDAQAREWVERAYQEHGKLTPLAKEQTRE